MKKDANIEGITMSLKKTIAEVVLLGILKWSVILVITGFVLYFVMPKYDYIDDTTRYNKISGKLEQKEIYSDGEFIWKTAH